MEGARIGTHDKFVGKMVRAGLPDLLANVPSMPNIYLISLFQEGINFSVSEYNMIFDAELTIPFIHTDPVSHE